MVQGGLSADLEQLLQQHAAVTAAAVSGGDGAADGGTDRAHSFHMPKIESMELPGGDHISEALRDALNPDSLHKALGMHVSAGWLAGTAACSIALLAADESTAYGLLAWQLGHGRAAAHMP